MSDKVTFFGTNDTPWAGIGKTVAGVKTSKEAMEKAGANFRVEKKPLFWERTDDNGNLIKVDVSDERYATVRMDTLQTLGTVGPNTEILQNEDSFAFFDAAIEANEAEYETAGVLDGGRKVWVLTRINRDPMEVVKGDEFLPFMLLSNSHDGKMAVRAGFTPIRVVCRNTLAIAHNSKDSQLVRLRHSKDVKKNLEDVKSIMKAATASFEATLEQYKLLASKNINQADLEAYVKIVLEMEEKDGKLPTRTQNILDRILAQHETRTGMNAEFKFKEQLKERVKEEENNEKLLEKIIEGFEAGRGTENQSSRGSFWTAYNAVTEHLNYTAGHKPETRLNSLWFGPNNEKNAEALKIALEMVDAK